jgi:hypothetical protein
VLPARSIVPFVMTGGLLTVLPIFAPLYYIKSVLKKNRGEMYF